MGLEERIGEQATGDVFTVLHRPIQPGEDLVGVLAQRICLGNDAVQLFAGGARNQGLQCRIGGGAVAVICSASATFASRVP